MNMQIRRLELIKTALASIVISCNNLLPYFPHVKPIQAFLVNLCRHAMLVKWIIFASDPKTCFRASFYRRLTQFDAGFRGMFFTSEVVTMNKLMPPPTIITGYGEATPTGAQGSFSVTYFSGLVKTFRRAVIKRFANSGWSCLKLLATIITGYFNRVFTAYVLADGRAI